MTGDPPIVEVRGATVRCSGPVDGAHPDVLIEVPARETVLCPVCGLRYQRAGWWNAVTGAIWPAGH